MKNRNEIAKKFDESDALLNEAKELIISDFVHKMEEFGDERLFLKLPLLIRRYGDMCVYVNSVAINSFDGSLFVNTVEGRLPISSLSIYELYDVYTAVANHIVALNPIK